MFVKVKVSHFFVNNESHFFCILTKLSSVIMNNPLRNILAVTFRNHYRRVCEHGGHFNLWLNYRGACRRPTPQPWKD